MARLYYTPPPDPPLPEGWRVISYWGQPNFNKPKRARVYGFTGRHGSYAMDPVHATCWRIVLTYPDGVWVELPFVETPTQGFETVARHEREPLSLADDR